MFMTIVIFCAAFAFFWFAVPFACRRLEERRLARMCRRMRAIVLSYDDGPSGQLSPDLIDLLDRHQARATVFMLGRNAERHPEMVERYRRGGHEIASHSQNHLNAWKSAPWAVWRDIAAGRRTLAGFGTDAALFRPPYGKLTLAGLIQAAVQRLRPAFWTVDSRDSWNRRPIDEVIADIETMGGGVVLMHDTDRAGRGPEPEKHPQYVLDLTQRLIDFAAANGFRLVRFGDLTRSGVAR